MTRGLRLGILGGTFNPIHLGHLRAAEEVREALGLERMILVPAARPPHKDDVPDDPIAPASLRLAWVRASVAENPAFEADGIEVERGGRSYTIDTVRAIGARTAPELPVFAIGQEAFAELGSWREPEALLRSCHFAVMTRPPFSSGALADWLPKCARDEVLLAPDGLSARHREAPTWLRRIEVTALDISSSGIRARLRASRSIRYLVPEAVREAVEWSGVYGPAGAR
ncbi:MAG TPA: nicotinate-nucleotide adenylyltransferase [Myxococcota bacterium]|nr:nicotinate-nucleotide adenylyltransferase [Myxococcota bacterium]